MGRANGGGGFNTAGNQGGGDKLQGLVSTTNRPVVFSSYLRTRADGGDSRNWVFCMNQLGGVGRRWGQAAGPGNRGGIHAACKAHAHRSRQRHTRRPKQSSGWGNPYTFRANPFRGTLAREAPLQDHPTCACFFDLDNLHGHECSDPILTGPGYVGPGLITDDLNTVTVDTLTLAIPWSAIMVLAEQTLNSGAVLRENSIWNGLNFKVPVPGASLPLSQIMQPVLRPHMYAVPLNNELPNYMSVYDQAIDKLTQSSVWQAGSSGDAEQAAQALSEYYDSSPLGNSSLHGQAGRAAMTLVYLEPSESGWAWKSARSDADEEFTKQYQHHKNRGGWFVNAQYVEFVSNYYVGGQDAMYDQISNVIIAVPIPDGTWPSEDLSQVGVTLKIGWENDGYMVTATVKPPVAMAPASQTSTLAVRTIHNPSSNAWKAGEDPGVFTTLPVPRQLPSQQAIPVQVEIVVDPTGAGCGNIVYSMWNGAKVQVGGAGTVAATGEGVDLLSPQGLGSCRQSSTEFGPKVMPDPDGGACGPW